MNRIQQYSAVWITLVLLLHSSTCTASLIQRDGFWRFLYTRDFKGWLPNPTENMETLIILKANSHLANFTCEISNQQIYYNSTDLYQTLSGNLLDGRLSFSVSLQFRVEGNYNFSGSVLSTSNISSDGRINITDGVKVTSLFTNFGVTEDGDHIHLSVAKETVTTSVLDNFSLWTTVSLEDFPEPYEEIVTSFLREKYREHYEEWLPIRRYIREYLDNTFSETSISTIIGWPHFRQHLVRRPFYKEE